MTSGRRATGIVVLFLAAGAGLGGVAAATDDGSAQVGIRVLPSPTGSGAPTTTPPATTTPATPTFPGPSGIGGPSPIVSGVVSDRPTTPTVPSAPTGPSGPTAVGGSLPDTGADVTGRVELALVLLGGGTLLTIAARRRRD